MSAGKAYSRQIKDANGEVVTQVFFAQSSRHVAVSTATGRVCTQITDLAGSHTGQIRFAEITSTVACHYKTSTTKAAVSGSLMTKGEHPYCPANFPKIIALGDTSFIGVRGAVGQIAGTFHITLLG